MICHPLLVPESPSDELLLRGTVAGVSDFEATHNGEAGATVSTKGDAGVRLKVYSWS